MSYKKIEIMPHDSNYPMQFEDEAKIIQKALGDSIIEIHHIGSTSISGMVAKPIIDILTVVKDMALLQIA